MLAIRQSWFAALAVLGLAALMLLAICNTSAQAKLPGSEHCYNDICHRVRTVQETEARRGLAEPVIASFYDWPQVDRFNPSTETSSGAEFDADAADNAASPIHPDGTVLLLWSPTSKRAAIVRVNNAGPYYLGRTLDVSRGVAEKLGFAKGGVAQLLSMVVDAPDEADARYRRGREYPKVPGYIGMFESLALASLSVPEARDALFETFEPLSTSALNTRPDFLESEKTQLRAFLQDAESEIVAPDIASRSTLATTIAQVRTLTFAEAGIQITPWIAAAMTLAESTLSATASLLIEPQEALTFSLVRDHVAIHVANHGQDNSQTQLSTPIWVQDGAHDMPLPFALVY